MTRFIRLILLSIPFSCYLLSAASEPSVVHPLGLDSLKEGDIIVFVRHVLKDTFTAPEAEAPKILSKAQVSEVQSQKDHEYEPYMDHLALYAGQDRDDNPLILHSTPLAFNPSHPHRPNGLCQTFLKNKIEYDPDLERYIFYTYDVIRCLDSDIAAAAFTALQTQYRFRVPYDQRRLDWKTSQEDAGWEDAQFCEHAQTTFKVTTYLKFLARHLQGKPLTTTSPDGVEKGITCSMAIVIGYNIGCFIAKAGQIAGDDGSLDDMLKRGCMAHYDKWVTCKYPQREFYVGLNQVLHSTMHERYKQFAIIPLEPKLAGAGGVVHFLHASEAFKKIGEITTLPSIMETNQEQRREANARASIDAERLRRCLSPQVLGESTNDGASADPNDVPPPPQFAEGYVGAAAIAKPTPSRSNSDKN